MAVGSPICLQRAIYTAVVNRPDVAAEGLHSPRLFPAVAVGVTPFKVEY